MLKKISVQNASYQILLKRDLRASKFLPSRAGRQKFIKNIYAAIAITFGTTQAIILSACLT